MKTILSNRFRHTAGLFAAALLMGSAPSAFAYDVNSSAAINVDANGVILRGVDSTSLRAGGTPAAGSTDFSVEVEGATYLFASAVARDSFVPASAPFKPAFGAFCAAGAALGKKLDGDPAIFRVFEGVLYLLLSEDAVALWDKDPAGSLDMANANWPCVTDKTSAFLE